MAAGMATAPDVVPALRIAGQQGAAEMTHSITRIVNGQTVSEVPGQPGRTITGRPTERVEIHNPVTVDPFAMPGATGYDYEKDGVL